MNTAVLYATASANPSDVRESDVTDVSTHGAHDQKLTGSTSRASKSRMLLSGVTLASSSLRLLS